MLLTGARPNEPLGLRWEDVAFQWKSLKINDKVEGERTIPLIPYVAALLARPPRRTMEKDGKTAQNPWVFSSPTSALGRLQDARKGHVKALNATSMRARAQLMGAS